MDNRKKKHQIKHLKLESTLITAIIDSNLDPECVLSILTHVLVTGVRIRQISLPNLVRNVVIEFDMQEKENPDIYEKDINQESVN